MAKKSGRKLEKVTFNLFAGDKETLIDFFSAVGWSVAARIILHKFCKKLRELDSQKIGSPSELKIEIPEDLEDFDESEPDNAPEGSRPKVFE